MESFAGLGKLKSLSLAIYGYRSSWVRMLDQLLNGFSGGSLFMEDLGGCKSPYLSIFAIEFVLILLDIVIMEMNLRAKSKPLWIN